MARFPFESTLVDQFSRIIVGGTVTVNLTGTSTAATVYAAESGGSAITDSQITTGSDGTYKFWVDDGDYGISQRFRLVLAGGSPFTTRTIDDVVVFPGITTGSTDTLTNKIIDADNNTISNLEHGAEVDEPSSGVHGVTGSIVGTTDTQILSAKTLTTPIIGDMTNANHDHADAAGGGNTLLVPTIASMANAGHDHADAAGGGNLGVVQATNLTLTGAAPATPVAHRLYTDNIVKGWVQFQANGTIDDAVNVTTVDDDNVGDWGINWVTDFAAANYAVVCGVQSSTTGQLVGNIGVDNAGKAAGTTEIICVNSTTGTTEVDEDVMYVIAVGQ